MKTEQSTRPESALPGTHELVVNTALHFAGQRTRVLKLGAWSGTDNFSRGSLCARCLFPGRQAYDESGLDGSFS